MRHVVSLSGGLASAVAAERVIERYGRSRVDLWFADTLWEDEDLYRFLDDCMARWGGRLIRRCDGRTPLEVAADRQIIPNQKRAPCSYELKTQLFEAWLWKGARPITVHLGLDWTEMDRIDKRRWWHRWSGKPRRPVSYASRVPGVYEDFPLLWRPYEFRPLAEVVRSWGIEPPRLYAMGFAHNNCGGRCVKQGRGGWLRLAAHFPERFAEVRDWEQEQREKGGPRADFAILRDQTGGTTTPLTLAELEARGVPGPGEPVQESLFEDRYACFCSY